MTAAVQRNLALGVIPQLCATPLSRRWETVL